MNQQQKVFCAKMSVKQYFLANKNDIDEKCFKNAAVGMYVVVK